MDEYDLIWFDEDDDAYYGDEIDDWYTDEDDEWETTLGNCWFGDECCIPGPHYPDECFTAEMWEAQQREYRQDELREKYRLYDLACSLYYAIHNRLLSLKLTLTLKQYNQRVRNRKDEIPF